MFLHAFHERSLFSAKAAVMEAPFLLTIPIYIIIIVRKDSYYKLTGSSSYNFFFLKKLY